MAVSKKASARITSPGEPPPAKQAASRKGSAGQGRERRCERRPIRPGGREEPHEEHPGTRPEPRPAPASKARLPLRSC